MLSTWYEQLWIIILVRNWILFLFSLAFVIVIISFFAFCVQQQFELLWTTSNWTNFVKVMKCNGLDVYHGNPSKQQFCGTIRIYSISGHSGLWLDTHSLCRNVFFPPKTPQIATGYLMFFTRMYMIHLVCVWFAASKFPRSEFVLKLNLNNKAIRSSICAEAGCDNCQLICSISIFFCLICSSFDYIYSRAPIGNHAYPISNS